MSLLSSPAPRKGPNGNSSHCNCHTNAFKEIREGPQGPQSLLTYVKMHKGFLFSIPIFLLFSLAQSRLCACGSPYMFMSQRTQRCEKCDSCSWQIHITRHGLENEKQMKSLFPLNFLSCQRLVLLIQQLRAQYLKNNESIQVVSTAKTLETRTESL